MLHLLITLHTLTLRSARDLAQRLRDDDGQSTAEYAMVLLGAAAVALLLLAWATEGNRIGELLDSVLDSVLDTVS